MMSADAVIAHESSAIAAWYWRWCSRHSINTATISAVILELGGSIAPRRHASHACRAIHSRRSGRWWRGHWMPTGLRHTECAMRLNRMPLTRAQHASLSTKNSQMAVEIQQPRVSRCFILYRDFMHERVSPHHHRLYALIASKRHLPYTRAYYMRCRRAVMKEAPREAEFARILVASLTESATLQALRTVSPPPYRGLVTTEKLERLYWCTREPSRHRSIIEKHFH